MAKREEAKCPILNQDYQVRASCVDKMQGLTLPLLAPLATARGLLSGGWISQLLATSLSCAVGVFEEAGQSRIPWAWASVVLHPEP